MAVTSFNARNGVTVGQALTSVIDASGNVTAGTLSASGDLLIATNKFTVASSTGNVVMSGGTLSVTATTGSTYNIPAASYARYLATAAPTANMVQISTNGNSVATADTSALAITYVGGTGNIESSAQKITITPGGTSGSTWSGIRIVGNTAASGVNQNGIKFDNITGGAGSETMIYAGTGWDDIIKYGTSTSVINGSGQVNAAQLTGTASAINGSAITSLNGTNISSGTVAFARLPTMYYADVAVASASSTTTTPTFGASVSTSSLTFDLANITATTVNFAGAALNLNIGHTGANTAITNINAGSGTRTLNIGTTSGGTNTVVIGHTGTAGSTSLRTSGTTVLDLQPAGITTNFYVGSATSNPIINFDSTDYLAYDRTNNQYVFYVGGVAELTLSASTATFATAISTGTNNITSTGTITGTTVSGTTVTATGSMSVTGTTKAAGVFYAGTTAPTNTTRLNFDGYLYGTKLYSGGTEVATTATAASTGKAIAMSMVFG